MAQNAYVATVKGYSNRRESMDVRVSIGWQEAWTVAPGRKVPRKRVVYLDSEEACSSYCLTTFLGMDEWSRGHGGKGLCFDAGLGACLSPEAKAEAERLVVKFLEVNP